MHLFFGYSFIQSQSSISIVSISILVTILLWLACYVIQTIFSYPFPKYLQTDPLTHNYFFDGSDPCLPCFVIYPYALQHLKSWTHATTATPS